MAHTIKAYGITSEMQTNGRPQLVMTINLNHGLNEHAIGEMQKQSVREHAATLLNTVGFSLAYCEETIVERF